MAVICQAQQVSFIPPTGAVSLIGDMTDWQRRPPIPVVDGQAITLRMPRNAWIEYAWLSATGEPFADPDNPTQSLNPWWSYPRVAEVGSYPQHLLWQQVQGMQLTKMQKGHISRQTWEGRVFEGTRRLVIYTPPNYAGEALPVYYVQDGVAFYRTGKLADLMDTALALNLVDKAAFIFVEPLDRNNEYYLNNDYLHFLQDEVFPRVEGELLHLSERGLWGASLGGLKSLYLGSHHPELFSRVVSHSGAFIAHPKQRQALKIDTTTAGEWLLEQLQKNPPRHLKTSLDSGVLEWLCGPNRRMAALFAEQGLEHQYREYASGHNWVTWRQALAEALLYMQGKQEVTNTANANIGKPQ